MENRDGSVIACRAAHMANRRSPCPSARLPLVRRSRPRRLVPFVAALLASVPSVAAAQSSSLPKHGNVLGDAFEPAPAGDPFFSQISTDPEGRRELKLGAVATYARRPVVLYNSDDSEAGALVSDRLVLHVGATVPLGRRLSLDADFPVTLVDVGDDTAGFVAPSGAAAGDLRLGARLRALALGPVQVALAGRLWLPTGNESELAGAGAVRAGPSLIVSGHAGSILYAVNGGLVFGPDSTFAGTEVDDRLTFGLGVGTTLARGRVQVGAELAGAAVLGGDDSFSSSTTNLEALFGGKLRLGVLVLGAGAGPGIAGGLGTPSLRGLLSVTYAPVRDDQDRDGIDDDDDACPSVPGNKSTDAKRNGCPDAPPPDRDADGILDERDACPDAPGVATNDPATYGCADTDRDGIFDTADACPTQPGVRSDNPRKNGCLLDMDRDGIVDERDACPDLAGMANADPTKNGCPPDRDADGIADLKDACPDAAGLANADPKKNGCPADGDADGVPDDRDACPTEAGVADPDPAKNGCPAPKEPDKGKGKGAPKTGAQGPAAPKVDGKGAPPKPGEPKGDAKAAPKADAKAAPPKGGDEKPKGDKPIVKPKP